MTMRIMYFKSSTFLNFMNIIICSAWDLVWARQGLYPGETSLLPKLFCIDGLKGFCHWNFWSQSNVNKSLSQRF